MSNKYKSIYGDLINQSYQEEGIFCDTYWTGAIDTGMGGIANTGWSAIVMN
jgi:hypothetical protein